MEQLDLKNQKAFEDLTNVFNEIELNILEDEEDIIFELENCMKELDDEDKQKVMKFINSKYSHCPFIRKFSPLETEGETQLVDFNEIYREIKQKNQHEKLLLMIRNSEFYKQNKIPTVVEQNISVLQKLGSSKLLDILLIWENQYDNNNISQSEFLKKILSIIYCQSLSNEEKFKVEAILGSFLVNQIYQFQIYIDAVEQKDIKQFKQFVIAIQQKQMSFNKQPNQDIMQEENFIFLSKLFTQDIRKSKMYLDNYLSDILQIDPSILDNDEICELVELSFLRQQNILELYFSVVWYLWTQYSIQYQLIDQLNQHEGKRDQTIEDRRQSYYERFLAKLCKQQNDQIYQYFIHRIIYFAEKQEQFISKQNYEKFKNQWEIFKNESQNTNKISIQELLQLPREEFARHLVNLKNLQYYQLDSLSQNEQIAEFLFIFWLDGFKFQDQERLFKVFHMSQHDIIACAELIKQQFYMKSKGFILYLLKISTKFYDFEKKDFIILEQIFVKNSSFRHGSTFLKFRRWLNQQEIQLQQIKEISELTIFQLNKIKYLFDQGFLTTLAQQVLAYYLNNLKKDRYLFYKALNKLFLIIEQNNSTDLDCFRIILNKLNHKLLHAILYYNRSATISKEIWQITMFSFYVLHDQLPSHEQQFISNNLSIFIQQNFYNFSLLHQLKVTNIDFNILHKIAQVLYYSEVGNIGQMQQLCEEIYFWNREFYKNWLEPLNYFDIFSINSKMFRRRELSKQYPANMNIELENFNISLAEISDEQQKLIVSDWVNNMNDASKFQKLIPLFFNIIKRGEGSQKLLSFIHQNKTKDFQGSINMKALFQILFNNSNAEMKTMLLKFWSKFNPVPFIFQNLNISRMTEEEHLYQFNQYIFYILQDSYSIINLTLSKNQSQIGKTHLINQIFFEMEKFETCDSCEINRDTIDIMFDYSFNGSRLLSIADVHGTIPKALLKKILPFFKFWIIQMDSEQELEENFNSLLYFNKIIEEKNPSVCFVVRNSQNSNLEKQADQIKFYQSKNIAIHFVRDLTSKEIDKQILLNEMENVSKFLYSEILKNYQKINFISQADFIKILQQFSDIHYEASIEIIQQQNEIIKNLQLELNKIIMQPDGFYCKDAFPLRSIEQTIKLKTEEKQKLLSDQNTEKNEELKQQIQMLKQEMDEPHYSKLMELFCSIFSESNFYILYLWFTDIIRKFNEEKTYQLQNENQELNEEIQRIKKYRESQKQKDGKQNDPQNQAAKERINQIKQQLIENLNKIQLINIGIEIFWRELIEQKQQNSKFYLQINPADKIYEMIRKGEPFEFLDGDQLKINTQFLKQLTRKFEKLGEERILIMSILGPQSSGKSTILNKIFGCHFWTSVGRCTKGIYLQLLKVHNVQYFNDQFDYVLLLDTEGLQNPNQQDPEFDKKIALFVLAVSDIILINVKGDIHQQFKNLVEMCIYTLGQLKSNFQTLKQLCWCFNQNNDVNNIAPFLDQIQGIATNLNAEFNKTDSEEIKIDYSEILDIKKQNIKILGFSCYEKSWKSSQFYRDGLKQQEWRQLITNETFSQEAYNYGLETIKTFADKIMEQKEQKNISNLDYFINNIGGNWDSIQRLPDLLEFSELIQHQQNQFMKAQFEEIYNRLDFSFTQQLKSIIFNEVELISCNGLDVFTQIEQRIEGEIIGKIQFNKKIATEDLQQVRNQNKVSKKIAVKYLEQLKVRIQNEESDCKMIINESIQNLKRVYQEKQGFAQIDKFVNDLLQNANELIKYQEQPNLISSKFKLLWQNLLEQQEVQQLKLFEEFQLNQYNLIRQCFSQYQMNSKIERDVICFLRKQINKVNPNENENEKYLIYREFEPELLKQNFQQLNYQNKKDMRYIDIFYLPIEQKFRNSQPTDLIQISQFFQICVNWKVIDKVFVIDYFKNKFYENMMKLLKKTKYYFQGKSFFQILDQFKVKCDAQLQDQILEKVKSFQNNQTQQKQILEDDLKQTFQKFVATLEFNLIDKCFIENDNFFTNFKQYYELEVHDISQQIFQNENHLTIERENLLKKFIILKEIKYIQPKEDDQNFTYIQNPRIKMPSNFQGNFTTKFNWIMSQQQGWEKLFNIVYDIIKNEMLENQSQKAQIDSEYLADDENTNFNISLIKIVMSKIELKIQEFNKVFSNFGLILKTVGERVIYFYSIFIVWRFICWKKWSMVERNKRMLQNNYPKQFEQFRAKITQDKDEQTKIAVQNLIKQIQQGNIERFYSEKRELALKQLQQKKMASQQLIKLLDEKLLGQNQDIQNEINKKNIVEYITDQMQFINTYVDNYLQTIQKDLENQFITELKNNHQQLLEVIKANASFLKNSFQDQIICIKELFYEENQKEQGLYEHRLYQIIVSCLEGQQNKNTQFVKAKYKNHFLSLKYKQIRIPIITKFTNQSDQQVCLLQKFIDQVIIQLDSAIQNVTKIQFNLSNLQIQSNIDSIRLIMRGCQHSCPMCKRKCDLDYENHEPHQCMNGHQLRGMNGVLIRGSTPSLYTCEEIEDNFVVQTVENGSKRSWKEIKQIYPEWRFRSLQTNEVYNNKIKMMNIWNNGIGKLICQDLEKKMNVQVQFQLKQYQSIYYTSESIHYIIVLDDSGSMEGKKWENVKKAAIQFIQQLEQNDKAKVSVIIFNSEARLVIDCKEPNATFSSLFIQYKGGNTDFEEAFNAIYQVIWKQKKKFEKIFVLFYTDGEAVYPKYAINKIISLSVDLLQRITFLACTDGQDAPILERVIKEFTKFQKAEVRKNLQTEIFYQVLQEVVSQNYHNLRF